MTQAKAEYEKKIGNEYITDDDEPKLKKKIRRSVSTPRSKKLVETETVDIDAFIKELENIAIDGNEIYHQEKLQEM